MGEYAEGNLSMSRPAIGRRRCRGGALHRRPRTVSAARADWDSEPLETRGAEVLAGAQRVPLQGVSWRRIAFRTLALLVVALGFSLASSASRGRREDSSRLASMLPVVPPLEHFMTWDSFSEAEQTRAELEALCLHFIADTRVRYIKARADNGAESSPSDTEAHYRGLAQAIERIQRGIQEFQGTEQVYLLEAELFRMYRRAGRDAEYVDRFLGMVYALPTHEIVESHATQALEAAARVGRLEEVRSALAHREEIPKRYWPAPDANAHGILTSRSNSGPRIPLLPSAARPGSASVP